MALDVGASNLTPPVNIPQFSHWPNTKAHTACDSDSVSAGNCQLHYSTDLINFPMFNVISHRQVATKPLISTGNIPEEKTW